MEALHSGLQDLLVDLARELDATCATVEILTEDGEIAETIATYDNPAPTTGALTWLELPVRDGSEQFARLRLAFAPSVARPRQKPWRIARTLADLAVVLHQMRWQQAAWPASQASRRILPVTEEELQRIILDIHDGPVQKLFAASSQVALMQARLSQAPEPTRSILEADLARLADLLQASLGEIKMTVGSLRPPEFRRRPLVSVIQGLIMQHEALTGVNVELAAEGMLPPVSLPVKIALYRILQEALANAHRHAGVDHLDVKLTSDGDWVVMDVSDRGRGFVPPPLEGPGATEREEHIGLRGMRERAQLVGGQFSLISQPGRGTRVQVRVPGE